MNYKLTISYDGTNYHGWQFQENGITVQEVMENAVSRLLDKKTAVIGCSRTDAGVHAKRYVCNFHGKSAVPADKIPIVMNMYLPPDIRVYNCEEADESFNSRFNALSKTYEYKILNSSVSEPLNRLYTWHFPQRMDVLKMQEASELIKGEKDFSSFCAAGSKVKSKVRNLSGLSVLRESDIITVRATANGFLYNMVRIITGTLVYVGIGKIKVEELPSLIENRDRRLLGITAPPCGLMLTEVMYE